MRNEMDQEWSTSKNRNDGHIKSVAGANLHVLTSQRVLFDLAVGKALVQYANLKQQCTAESKLNWLE